MKWTTMAIEPIHLAAYLLNPASHGIELDTQEDLTAMRYIYELAKDNFWKSFYLVSSR